MDDCGFTSEQITFVNVKDDYITSPVGSRELNADDMETLASLIECNRNKTQLDIIIGKRWDVERIVDTLSDHDHTMDWTPTVEPKGKERAHFVDLTLDDHEEYYHHDDDYY